jgi:carotenoid 1,2-hydratase
MAHCAMNVALYGDVSRWAMTERNRAACDRTRDHFQIGPSSLSCSDRGLTWNINEIANPLPRRLHGQVFADMGQGWHPDVFSLTADAAHRWGPLQARARVQVRFERPALKWEGWAYIDSNEGDEAIHEGFSDWDWSRAHLADHTTAVLYDVRSPGMDAQNSQVLAMRFTPGQGPERFNAGIRQSLGKTAWGIQRHSFREGSKPTRLEASLEDTPFYARSVIRATMLGEDVVAMHETLDARRFASPWVQSLLPWRMPRRA